MNTTEFAILTVSSLSLITSAATLVVMLKGAKKVQAEVEEVKTQKDEFVQNLKTFANNL